MEWIKKFVNVHGERIFFMGVASLMAIGFIVVGAKIESLSSLSESGTTILIGVAMLCYNKARGNGKEPPKEQ